MTQMRAVLIKNGKGNADALYIGEAERPSPIKGQVLVKVVAFGLNRMDIHQREGQYPLPPGASEILGVEFSGTVAELGEGVDSFKVGDEVLGLTTGGAYAEYVTAYASHVLSKPKELSWVKAAGVLENWITSYQALVYIGKFAKGDTVLVHGGASGIGLAVAQLAHLFKGRCFTTVSSQDKIDFVKSVHNGATDAINYKTQDFASEIKKATDGKGVDVVVDFIGQNYFKSNIESLAYDGRMVMLGLLSGGDLPAGISLAPLLFKRLTVSGSTLRARSPAYQANLIELFKRDAFEHFIKPSEEDGKPPLDIYIDEVYPWQNVIDAHKKMETNANSGKIILEIK